MKLTRLRKRKHYEYWSNKRENAASIFFVVVIEVLTLMVVLAINGCIK